MKHHQKGFTIIELIVVIIILGILSAIAVPRFVDMTKEAADAAAAGTAGAVSSASALNMAERKLRGTTHGKAVTGTAAGICVDTMLNDLLQNPVLGSTKDFAVSAVNDADTCAATGSVNCLITKNNAPADHAPASAAVICVD
jgi:MSHA pilin protein MshA